MESKEAPKLVLYCYIGCPFARRAMITAQEKGIELPLIPIPLSGVLKKLKEGGLEAIADAAQANWPGKTADEIVQIKEDYKRDINAKGEVPTLILTHPDGSTDTISEADVISEFFEDYAPDSGTSLMPKDAVARSKVRHWIKVLSGDTGVAAMYRCLTNQDPAKDEEKRAALHKGMASFARLANDAGPYFLGEQYSLADAMLQPMWDQFRLLLPHYRATELIPSVASPDQPWVARMQEWAAAIEQREVHKKVSLTKEQYVAAYAGYANPRGISQFGQ